MNIRALTTATTGLIACLVVAFAPHGASAAKPPICPPLLPTATNSKAQCTFDIWGYVRRADTSAPLQGATLTDSLGKTSLTDDAGYFDLFEGGPGTYGVTASDTDCASKSVVVADYPPSNLVDGGVRQDFSLTCI